MGKALNAQRPAGHGKCFSLCSYTNSRFTRGLGFCNEITGNGVKDTDRLVQAEPLLNELIRTQAQPCKARLSGPVSCFTNNDLLDASKELTRRQSLCPTSGLQTD